MDVREITSSGFGFIKISANVVARQHELALTLGIFISIPFSWYPTAHADDTRRTHPVLLNLLILKPSTNQSLEGKDGVGRVDNSLSLSRQANKTFPMFRKGHYRWLRLCTFSILNNC